MKAFYPLGFIHPGSWSFSIGYYTQEKTSVSVTLHCGEIGEEGYKSFHMHDYFGIVPRFIRIGVYIFILDRKARFFYSKNFPEWREYLLENGGQPPLEFTVEN